jgi:polyisoprenoid-binding protein YceI
MELTMKLLKLLVLSTALALFIPAISAGPVFAADPEPDSIVVLARHTEAKPTDPVRVQFTSFKVTKASFDPKKVEGGKATIEIDATSLKTGADKRDAHLNTPDFLDTKKFPKITVDIDKVKKKADKTFTAEATVKFRDVTKKYPVTFDVIETKADSIRIKAETTFSRLDFKVGKDPKEPKAAPVQTGLTIQMQLTLKKT